MTWRMQPSTGGTLAMYPVGTNATPEITYAVPATTDGTITFSAPSGVPAVEFRLYGDSGLLLATSAATILEANPPACASAGQPRQVVPEIHRVVTTVGEQYDEVTFDCYWASGPVVLAGDRDGQAPFAADDAMSLHVVRTDGTRVSWSFDFSAGCTAITDIDPVDISPYLQPGINRVTIKMNDVCGVNEGNAPMFLSIPSAPVDNESAPPPMPRDVGHQSVGK